MSVNVYIFIDIHVVKISIEYLYFYRHQYFTDILIIILRCPDELIEQLKWINFPPIISKQRITLDHLSDYMKKRYEEEGRKLDQESLVQTFRGENLFVFSELLKFYLHLGYEIRNVRMATQYLGEKCFAPFISKVVNMRIRAEKIDNDPTKVKMSNSTINP